MTLAKYKVGDRVEFYMSSRSAWVIGRVAGIDRVRFGKGIHYKCESTDFPASGCAAWVKAKSIRPVDNIAEARCEEA